MNDSTVAIDRRQFIRLVGWGIIGAATVLTVSDIVQRAPRVFPERIIRDVGQNAIPVPRSWVDALPRVSIEGMPLDKQRIDSIPMLPVDKDGYCKTGVLVQKLRHGITIPDMYEKIGMDYSKTGGRIIATATDWYALVPENPESAFFSASKENIPREFWNGKGFVNAQKTKMTPYGCFPLDDKAWHKLSDCYTINGYRGEAEPGTYFIGADGNIIVPENLDVSMSLDKLVLSVNNASIPYSKIKKMCEEQRVSYNGKELASMPLKKLISIAGFESEGKALIINANNYAVSIPPWRQEDVLVVFDEDYVGKYGTPAKLIGKYLNKAAQIGGFYGIKVT
ncbi:hypothetical protein JW756_02695 [Candidatus Woesearchaeota archaeon]|nr:hypothetical protein [Candidatus Woesearchaeota archaeon]